LKNLKKLESLENLDTIKTIKKYNSKPILDSNNLVKSEKRKSLINRRSSILSNINNYNNYCIDEDMDFKILNDYEKKRIINLLKEQQNIKNYKKFILCALKDKNFFKTIDSIGNKDDINIMHKSSNDIKQEELHLYNCLNLNNNNDTIKSSMSNKNNTIKSKPNSYESSMSSKQLKISSSNNLNKYIKNENILQNSEPKLSKKKMLNVRNNKLSQLKKSLTLKNGTNVKINKMPLHLVNSMGDIYQNQFLSLSNKKSKMKVKRYTHSFKNNSNFNFLKTINEDENANNEYLMKYQKYKIKDLKHNNIFKKKSMYNVVSPKFLFTKEDNLDYLFKRINSQIHLDVDFINELKEYFIKNKDLSEESLNNYINKKYEIKHLLFYCNSISQKVKDVNIKNKIKKQYLSIGKFDDIKSLLEEEEKQDYCINHLFQTFMNSVDRKYNCFESE
jgi:hypothetical protein